MYLGDNNIVRSIKIESIFVKTIVKNNVKQICIKSVLYMPKLHANFSLVNKLVLNDLNVQFNLNKCIVKSCKGEAIAITPHKGNLYKINFVNWHKPWQIFLPHILVTLQSMH